MSLTVFLLLLLSPQQSPPPPNPGDDRPLFGGVPSGPPTGAGLDLTLRVAGERGVAEESRIDAARAQLETARALHELAQDRKKAGLVPSLDVLRAEVERAAREQETIVAEARLAKAKLALARAIGLPLGQRFRLAEHVPYSPAPILPLEEALKTA